MTRENRFIPPDDWLAEFTDNILSGDATAQPSEGPDPESRVLAATLIRLARAFPGRDVDLAVSRRIKSRVLKQHQEAPRPRWLDIFQMTRRQQFAYAMIALVAVLVIASPFFADSGALSASAGLQITGALIWAFLGVLAVTLAWLMRRKP